MKNSQMNNTKNKDEDKQKTTLSQCEMKKVFDSFKNEIPQ